MVGFFVEKDSMAVRKNEAKAHLFIAERAPEHIDVEIFRLSKVCH
jgi:hypothetical protein